MKAHARPLNLKNQASTMISIMVREKNLIRNMKKHLLLKQSKRQTRSSRAQLSRNSWANSLVFTS